jgi:hypothetical protein
VRLISLTVSFFFEQNPSNDNRFSLKKIFVKLSLHFSQKTFEMLQNREISQISLSFAKVFAKNDLLEMKSYVYELVWKQVSTGIPHPVWGCVLYSCSTLSVPLSVSLPLSLSLRLSDIFFQFPSLSLIL